MFVKPHLQIYFSSLKLIRLCFRISPHEFNMASTSDKQGKGAAKPKTVPPEQIELGFQELRQQQRAIASKMSELEMERKEHEYVLCECNANNSKIL